MPDSLLATLLAGLLFSLTDRIFGGLLFDDNKAGYREIWRGGAGKSEGPAIAGSIALGFLTSWRGKLFVASLAAGWSIRSRHAIEWTHGEKDFLGQLRRARTACGFLPAALVGAVCHDSGGNLQLVARVSQRFVRLTPHTPDPRPRHSTHSPTSFGFRTLSIDNRPAHRCMIMQAHA